MRVLVSAFPLLLCALALPHPQDEATPISPSNSDATSNQTNLILLAAVNSAFVAAGFEPYVAPKAFDPITEWLAIGDSYTAAIGSNGIDDYDRTSFDCQRYLQAYPLKMNRNPRMPGIAGDRKLNFGACSGKKMKDVRDNQIKDKPAQGYVAFGKPQIAVMTIGGNDISFVKAINACVLRASPLIGRIPDCNTKLTEMEQKLDSEQFQGDLDKTFLDVLVKGRVNRGADPPKSFQLFVEGYVPFWNEVDKGCDTVSWVWWPWRSPAYLTTELRKRMNDIVRKLNLRIKESAIRMSGEGVVYVEGYQDSYRGHQFCDPVADQNLKKPIGVNTWFWHDSSPWNNAEGPRSATDTGKPLSELILNHLVPDEANRTAILNGKLDPAQVIDIDTEEKFEAAVDNMAKEGDPEVQATPIRWKRIFHPKGSAFNEHARVNIDAIIASRSGGKDDADSASQPKCQKGTLIKASDLQASIDTLKTMGNNPTKDNCCGGGVLQCGPLLAQNGTASISLCSAEKQCMGCGDLAGVMDGMLKTCVADGTLTGASGTIEGRNGLTYEVGVAST